MQPSPIREFYYCETSGRYYINRENFEESIVDGPFSTFEEAHLCAMKHYPDDCDYGVFAREGEKIFYYSNNNHRRDIEIVPAQWEVIL